MENQEKFNRGFGLWSSLALVVGTIIGTGIFFKQGKVLSAAGDTNTALLAWVVGGVITLASALSVAELGSQMPYTGGLYNYIGHLYGKTVGFLSGWMQVAFYGPAMMGAVGAYFSVLLTDFLGWSASAQIPIAIATLVIMGILNSIPNRFTAGFQVLTTSVKLIPIAALIIYGLFFGNHSAFGQSISGVQSNFTSFGAAVLATLFAYDGWITLSSIAGEIKNPKKTMPIALVGGVSIVLLAYVGISYGIYQSLSGQQIADLGQNATLEVAKQAFGQLGGRLLSLAILVSIIGTLNGKIVAFPRVLYAMGEDKVLPFSDKFASLHKTFKTPNFAIWTMLSIATIMILVTDADALSDMAIFATFLFYILAFIGVFKMRRENKAERPFSSPLFPLMPIVAIVGSLYIEISTVFNEPFGVAVSVGVILIGLPVYWLASRK